MLIHGAGALFSFHFTAQVLTHGSQLQLTDLAATKATNPFSQVTRKTTRGSACRFAPSLQCSSAGPFSFPTPQRSAPAQEHSFTWCYSNVSERQPLVLANRSHRKPCIGSLMQTDFIVSGVVSIVCMLINTILILQKCCSKIYPKLNHGPQSEQLYYKWPLGMTSDRASTLSKTNNAWTYIFHFYIPSFSPTVFFFYHFTLQWHVQGSWLLPANITLHRPDCSALLTRCCSCHLQA